ncbi:helix-turn-helix domain-containing protein [Flavobacterium eburneipallidum]|uniref:helix-turn-helix domain-containing protein n=1 Tax=Flavobacterium eburneipallidum TaxID=3003263 RepID=UPI0022AC47D9|nr:helix-turn-helix transcriptional regulator [Flavobacterium eburneipallidum]
MVEATTGLVIKGLREKYGYTQDKVANYLGIKREMISFYENESREIPLDVLERLSDLFGVELDVFFVDNVDDALAEVVFAFRKDDMDNDDMDNMAAFGKIVKNYLKINNLYGSI